MNEEKRQRWFEIHKQVMKLSDERRDIIRGRSEADLGDVDHSLSFNKGMLSEFERWFGKPEIIDSKP